MLATVLQEVKNRSLPVYNRLISLVKSPEKRFYVFFNEFRQETHADRFAGETINDRNDRAIRLAVKWYSQHLTSAVQQTRGSRPIPTILLLSNDKDCLRKARDQGMDAEKLRDYVSTLPDSERLLDLLADREGGQLSGVPAGRALFPEHYSISKMTTGLKNVSLYQGIFNTSGYNFLEGSVKVPSFDRALLIRGRESMNRATQGDVVVIELLPKDQWKGESAKIVEEDTFYRDENAEEDAGDGIVNERECRALRDEIKKAHSDSSGERLQPTAKVVGIVRRNWRQYVALVDSNSVNTTSQGTGKQQTIFVKPMDRKVSKIRIRTRQAAELINKRIVVMIDSWPIDSRFPVGHFIRSLGELETKEAETEALLLEYDVQYRPFAQAILDCLPSEGHSWAVPSDPTAPSLKDRQDLRELIACSIDPPGCQDIDDALHARPLPNGNIEVGVHIADVTHFVKPNNAMDSEASVRGTTVYLVDKRIDMLPPLLGTDLCSLKPHVDRFAFSAIWELTPKAETVSTRFTKAIIRSREAFSYSEAQLRIDDPSQTDPLTQSMRTLLALSKQLRARRMAAGALNLASPEVKVQLESETSDPVDVQTKQSLATNSLVEEFMLLANIAVASKIQASFPQSALLRRHADPPAANFEELAQQLRVRKPGMQLSFDSSRALADSLDTCVDPAHPFFNTLVRILATRCMTSAEYFVAGARSAPEFRHYGLATEIYTHFTSPIRRYADVVVHRQLAAAIQDDARNANSGFNAAVAPTTQDLDMPDVDATPEANADSSSSIRDRKSLERAIENINVRHRNAQLAGRASVAYYVGQALKGRVVEEEAWVMRVFENGLVVFVQKFGIEQLVRIGGWKGGKEGEREMEMEDVGMGFDGERYEVGVLVGGDGQGNGGRRVRVGLFDRVRVRISEGVEKGSGRRVAKVELL